MCITEHLCAHKTKNNMFALNLHIHACICILVLVMHVRPLMGMNNPIVPMQKNAR